MIQVTLVKFPATSDNLDILKKLYKSILYKDKYWHFLWEERSTIICCTQATEKKLGKKLRELKILYNCKQYSEAVRQCIEFLDNYLGVLHFYSELAMILGKAELLNVDNIISKNIKNVLSVLTE